MTRPSADVAEALRLAAHDLSPTEISRRTGTPRRTGIDWMAGRVPRTYARPTSRACPRCGRDHDAIQPAVDRYVYLLGMYLGDGCISSHPRDVYRLRITLDTAHPQIIEETATAMRAVASGARVNSVKGSGNCVQVSSYSKTWPCLFPQHGPDPKHKRRIVLEPWQLSLTRSAPESLLRGLIHSDGCRFMNTGRGGWRHPRYSFANASEDIRKIFCDACDVLGLHWTASNRTIYVSRKADVARMDEFIGPKR